MRFQFIAFDDATPVISVDGIAATGPNFSHWPGNRTPTGLKADTSTEIAIRLATLPKEERERLLLGLEVVANNHFDSDGILSCLVTLRPELALAHRDLLIGAATTGDFQVFTTEAALAIDLTLMKLGSDEGPFGAELERLEGVLRGQRQYEIGLAAAVSLLEDPFERRDLIADELAAELEDLDFANSPLVAVDSDPSLDLAIVTSPRPLRRIAVNSIAAGRSRVLSITPAIGGRTSSWLYRFHDRVDTWFEMASPARRAKRVDKTRLAQRLAVLAGETAAARWIAQSIDSPVPELYFGVVGTGRSFGGSTPGELAPSELPPEVVTRQFREFFATEGGFRD